MSAKQGFRMLQQQFTAAIRNPEQVPPPAGVEPRRMRIYQELLFNNVAGFVDSAFPVTLAILGDEEAEALKRRFFSRHRCQTPYFLQIAEECFAYVEANEQALLARWPFLIELMHYEWVELAASVAEGERPTQVRPDGDLLVGIPALSPFVWPLAYQWPVHRLSADWQPAVTPEEPTYLLVYRDADDDVCFMEINALTALLVETLQQVPGETGRQVIARLAEATGQTLDVLLPAGSDLFRDLRARGVLLGTVLTPLA